MNWLWVFLRFVFFLLTYFASFHNFLHSEIILKLMSLLDEYSEEEKRSTYNYRCYVCLIEGGMTVFA